MKKRSVLLALALALLLLLSGCGRDAAEDILAQQIILENHDAFLVPTGGKLGTLMVTADIGGWEELMRPVTFSVWRTDDLTTPIQEMISDTNEPHHSQVVDANFDGHKDFGYIYNDREWHSGYEYVNSSYHCYWHYWIWDEEQGQFVAVPEFDEISCPEFDPKTGIISGYGKDICKAGPEKTYTFHQWIDGKLTCIRRVAAEPWTDGETKRVTITVEEPVDGTLTEIFRGAYGLEAFDREAEKWRDLNYHGET